MNSRRQNLHKATVLAVLGALAAVVLLLMARRVPVNLLPESSGARSVAAAPTPTPWPKAGPAQQAPVGDDGLVTLLFLRTREPVADAIVSVGSEAPFMSDALGRIPRPVGSAEMRVVDRATSLTLFQGALMAGGASELLLPEPVRLTADVVAPEGTPPREIIVRWGHGEEMGAEERMRRESGSMLRPAPNEDLPWGIRLKPGPLTWDRVPVSGEGKVETPWFLAVGAGPQVVAFDGQWRWASARVEYPAGLAPRATLDVGRLVLQDPAVLEVEAEFPPGILAADLGLGLKDALPYPGHEEQAAQLLGMLDRIDPATGSFARGLGNIPVVRPGILRIGPLPPLSQVVMVARGATPDQVPERTFDLEPGKVTRVRFAAADLFPVGGPTRDVELRFVLEGTQVPVAGVRVTVAAFAQTFSGLTGEDGTVRFAGVPATQALVFSIEAFDTNDPPRFSRAWTVKLPRLEGGDPGGPWRQEWSVPAFRWLILPREGIAGRGLPGGQPILSVERSLDNGATWQPAEVADSFFEEDEFWLEVTRVASYRVTALAAPLVLLRSEAGAMGPDDFQLDLGWDARSRREAKPFELRVVRADGSPLVGVTVQAHAPTPGAQPIEATTDAKGIATYPECNLERIRVQLTDGTDAHAELDATGGSGVLRVGE